MTQLAKIGRAIAWLSPVVIVVSAFFAAVPWLKTLDNSVVMLIGGSAAVFVMGYAVYASYRCQRGQDEVQRAAARFAFQTGALGGSVVTVLLMLLPPFQTLVVGAASYLGTGSAETADRESVLVAFAFGFCVLSLAQTVGTLVASAGWWMAKQ